MYINGKAQLFALMLACLLVTLSLVLTGCGSGSDGGIDGSGSPGGESGPAPVDVTPIVLPPIISGDLTAKSGEPLEQQAVYFSYDESASTASRDLTFQALAFGSKPDKSWARPYEYLNAEEFEHFDLTVAAPFNISMGLYKATGHSGFRLPLTCQI